MTPPERFSTSDVGGSAAATGSETYIGSDLGARTGADMGTYSSAESSGVDGGGDMPLLADEDDPLSDTESEETMTGEEGGGRAPQ